LNKNIYCASRAQLYSWQQNSKTKHKKREGQSDKDDNETG